MTQAEHEFPGWTVVEKLGEGGMCAVYRAIRDEDGQERALKVLLDQSAESIERFLAEGRLLQGIDHPSVVRVHSLMGVESPPWLVMELLAGRDLDEELHDGPFEPERAARVIAEVADGLAAVHALGFRHRDIKPANIIVGHDGVPRLIDFGIARHIEQSHLTTDGMVVGTAAYLPPEVFFEDSPRDAQDTELADVFSLGQTLCELLIGQPVHGRTGSGTSQLARLISEKMDRTALDPRDWSDTVPAELAAIVVAATEQEPTDRLPTARDLAERLRGWLTERQRGVRAPVSSHVPTSLPTAPVKREARSSAATAAGGVLGLLAVGGLLVVVLGAGLAVLWLFRPTPGVDEATRTALRDAVVASNDALARCGGGGRAVLRWQVAEGGASGVEVVEGTADQGVDRCLGEAISAARFPDTPPLWVQCELRLR